MIRKLKLLFMTVVVSAMSVGVLALAPTQQALAGQDYWSTSDCRPDVWWYNRTGTYGTWYWWANGAQQHFVGGRVMDAYSYANWQCGSLGAPRSDFEPNTGYQYFEYGEIYYDQLSGCYKVYLSYYGYSYGCF